MVLAVDGEFAGFVSLMECFRHDTERGDHFDYVVVLSSWRHQTLHKLYRNETGAKILWGGGPSGLLQQALMLQPKSLVFSTERANWSHFLRGFHYAQRRVSPSKELLILRNELMQQLGLFEGQYVLMSVYTKTYEVERNPRFLKSVRLLETVGDELVPGVDYLVKQNLGVILLGSPDTGRSKIPRQVLRLSEFGSLGGPEEVALASGCKYFWTDNVGAWWLTAPFQRPVLHTNFHHKTARKPTVGRDLFVPRRYQTPDGRLLTLRDMLYMEGSPYKAALRGELLQIRNSREEVLEAQQEMLARVNGKWFETSIMRQRREYVEQLYSDYSAEDLHPLRMPAAFLERHEYLLG
jgi:putative glycosyltransferase (TIGR04372 family)